MFVGNSEKGNADIAMDDLRSVFAEASDRCAGSGGVEILFSS